MSYQGFKIRLCKFIFKRVAYKQDLWAKGCGGCRRARSKPYSNTPVIEVERLGAALARQSGQNEDEAVRHLWGKLAILLQRGNAAILANRVPDFPAPAIDGRH